MMIGGSNRVDRLERRMARLEDIIRQLALMFGIEGIDRELARGDEPPPAESSAIVDQRGSGKRR
jgi:hypothetical protein